MRAATDNRAQAARVCLAFLALAALVTGLQAAFDPRGFYDSFPVGRGWVQLLPAYNEHLVTDVGGFYLGFGLLFAWAAWTLERALMRAAASAWLLATGLHLIFHATHLENFDTGDAIAEVASLGIELVPALIVLWVTRAE